MYWSRCTEKSLPRSTKYLCTHPCIEKFAPPRIKRCKFLWRKNVEILSTFHNPNSSYPVYHFIRKQQNKNNLSLFQIVQSPSKVVILNMCVMSSWWETHNLLHLCIVIQNVYRTMSWHCLSYAPCWPVCSIFVYASPRQKGWKPSNTTSINSINSLFPYFIHNQKAMNWNIKILWLI